MCRACAGYFVVLLLLHFSFVRMPLKEWKGMIWKQQQHSARGIKKDRYLSPHSR